MSDNYVTTKFISTQEMEPLVSLARVIREYAEVKNALNKSILNTAVEYDSKIWYVSLAWFDKENIMPLHMFSPELFQSKTISYLEEHSSCDRTMIIFDDLEKPKSIFLLVHNPEMPKELTSYPA